MAGVTHLADILTGLAEREPERPIFTFLRPDRDEQTITAGELHRDDATIAACLAERGVRAGEIVPLVFDHGYDLIAAFWGAIYLGAAPTILPYLAREARARAYLAQVTRLARFAHASSVVTALEFPLELVRGLEEAGIAAIPLPPPGSDTGATPTAVTYARDPSALPYIQFSSGTTGSPKGVLLSHSGLLAYLPRSTANLGITSDDVTVGWLPLYHDMGLATQILHPLYLPHRCVLMSPTTWLAEPHRLLQAIHRFRGTLTWMPNFAFRYCTRRIRDEQIAGVDLSSWRIAGNASEPVRLEDVEAFNARFAPYGLRPEAATVSYGLAEHVAAATRTPHATAPDVDWVLESGLEERRAIQAEPRSPGSRAIVSCGYPLEDVALRVADDAGRDLPDREVGEVLLRSACVCNGYYALPEESAAILRDGWLRTEDLGYLVAGQIYICGRQKDLIIVGGRNIHPNYLETLAAPVLGDHARFLAAFGVPNPQLGTEMPVIVGEMRQRPDPATRDRLRRAVKEAIQRSLQLHVGDVHLVERGWIVTTTSGKINRSACRAKYLSEAEHAAAQAPAADAAVEDSAGPAGDLTPTERRLLAIWESLLQRSPIGIDEDFFELGGDSLLAAELAMEIEERFQCVLPASVQLESPTIRALARLLDDPPAAGAEQTLIPFRPLADAPTRPVFFCVHGLGGGVLDYQPLAQALGPDQPFCGLQARGLDGTSPMDTSVEAMAAHYVKAIKEFQPDGPYHVGGYCFGGVVAYEVARQLRAAEDDVALVAILEGYAPVPASERNGLVREWRFLLNFLRSLPYWLNDYRKLGRLQRRARGRRALRVAGKRLLRLLGRKVELAPEDRLDGLRSRPAQLQRVLESHIAAARQYAPMPYDGRVALFRTPHRLLQSPANDMGWGELSTVPVDVEVVAGNHATMLAEPHVKVLAASLRQQIGPSRGA